MDCPVCRDQQLSMADRQGIEIDFCPKCRGVWLDRGELDKILERTIAEVEAAGRGKPEPAFEARRPAPRPDDRRDDRREYDRRDHDRRDDHPKKKKHWLFEIFD